MSQAWPKGALESLAIALQEPPPAARRSKTTVAVSAEAEAESETEPRRFAPGSASETVGGLLSTVTVTTPR